MKTIIITTIAGAALAASAAYAQTQQQQTPPRQPPAAQQQPGMQQPGMQQQGMQQQGSQQQGAQATKPVTYYTQSGEDYRVSRIIGVNVRNNQNESVGEVEDLIMDPKGDVKAAIISVGGFLGIGERWVAVNYESLNMMPDGNNFRVVMNTTRDQMKSAPEFKYESSWTQRDRTSTTATTPRSPASPGAPADSARPSAPPPAGTPPGETPPSPR